MMMILLPEYAINCCLLARSRHLGSGEPSSDGGEQVKINCMQGKQGETGAPMFFSLSIFRPCFTI